jgi:catechol-2,3-dioxygenase
MIEVKRLGHATISTPDIETQTDYYSRILSLSIIERSKERVFLGTKQGLEAIELVRGEPNQLKRLSFQIAPGSDLKEVAKTLRNDGIKCELRQGISPGVSHAVTFEDPKGTLIDLYAKYNFAKSDGIPSIFNILKLGHVAYRVLDVQKVVKCYTDILGFRVSDWRGDYFVFMRCNTDHHTVNFIIDEEPQLHHIAFEVVEWAEIRKACDYLAHNKVQLVWGPGLVRVEIFTEMDQMKDEDLGYFDPRPWHQEFPLYPKMHGPETLRNYWGYGSERVIKGYQTSEVPQYGAMRE